MSRLSSWTSNLLVAGAALALAALAGEAALRAAGFWFPNFWQPDPVLGSMLRPGMDGWETNEGRARVRINSQGMRDREHALAKPAGTYRIAVLGDSYAEARQVDAGRAFWALLPARLEACGFGGGRRVETLNFGVSGYGTAQELLMLERAAAFSPDLVLLAFFPGNDVRNNSRALDGAPNRPYFELRDGALRLDASFRAASEFREGLATSMRRSWLQQVRLYQLARRVRAGSLAQSFFHNAPIASAIAAGEQGPAGEAGLDEQVFHAPADAAWREAWTLTEALILQVADETKRRGAGFLLTVLSTPGTVYPDARLRERYAASLGVESLFYPEERLGRLAAVHGLDIVPLAPDMQRRADASGVFLHGFGNTRQGFGHWNESGHALAAELIADHLCARS